VEAVAEETTRRLGVFGTAEPRYSESVPTR
jgi:hypothetical protein